MIYENILVSYLVTCSISLAIISYHYLFPIRGDFWQQYPSSLDNVAESEVVRNQ